MQAYLKGEDIALIKRLIQLHIMISRQKREDARIAALIEEDEEDEDELGDARSSMSSDPGFNQYKYEEPNVEEVEKKVGYCTFAKYTMYIVYCTIVHAMYNVYCITMNMIIKVYYSCYLVLYNVHCTLYYVHCTVYNVHCAMYYVQCTSFIVQCNCTKCSQCAALKECNCTDLVIVEND